MDKLPLLILVAFFLVTPVNAGQMSISNLCNGYRDCGTTKTATEGYVCNETGGSGDYANWTYTIYIPYNISYVSSDALALTGYMGREGSYTTNSSLACRGVQGSVTCNACDSAGTNTCSGVAADDNTYACCSADYASGVGVYFYNYTCVADACQDHEYYTQMIVLGRRHSGEGGWDGIEENGFTPYLNSYRWRTVTENTEVTNNTGWKTTNYAIKSSCTIGTGQYGCPQIIAWNSGINDAVESKVEQATAQARYYEWWWPEYINVTVNGEKRWYNMSGDFIGTNETPSLGMHDFTYNAVTFYSTKPFCLYVNGTDRLSFEPMTGYKNIFDDIGYKITPLSLSVWSQDYINLSVHSESSTLEYWGLNVTYENGTCLNCNISTLADGGYMYNNFSTPEDRVIAKFYFKKVDYSEWTISKIYIVHNITSGAFSLFQIFSSQLGNSSIMSPLARDISVLFVITAISIPVGMFSPVGGGFVAVLGLGASTLMGWFSVNLFIMLILVLGAIIILMVIGK